MPLLPHLPAQARLVGVDREEAFLELAREGTDPLRSTFVVGTAENLPFEDASFDLVTCQLVMIHLADPMRALAEMRRVLRGLLVEAGLDEVMTYTNDRAIPIHPPYERADTKVAIDQERAWYLQGVSVLCGSQADNLRFYEAGEGTRDDFDREWAAVERWMTAVQEGIARGDYHSARGFVMYLVSGRNT